MGGLSSSCEPDPAEEKSRLADPSETRRLHNQRVACIGSLHCVAGFESTYVDDQGERHRDTGEGFFAFDRRSGCVSLSANHLGRMVGAIGCDDRYFWCIEPGAHKVLYARNSNAERAIQNGYPGPVHPLQLLALAGLVEIPESAGVSSVASPLPATTLHAFRFPWTMDYEVELLLDARDATVQVVKVFRPDDPAPAATASLSAYEKHEGPSGVVVLPGVISLRVDRHEEEIRIRLNETKRRSPNRSLFDLDDILERLSDSDRVVLDAGCPNPAPSASIRNRAR